MLQLAAGGGFNAPTVEEFFPKPYFKFDVGPVHFEITRIMIISWIATVAVVVLMLWLNRRPALVPSKRQWLGESVYGFIRSSVAQDVIGVDGVRFAPYLSSLFLFILANNFMGIVPFFQVAPTAKISLTASLALISWVLFNLIGVRRKGFGPYFKEILFPPGVPWPLYFLLTPIEFFSTIIVRPFTLAVRLFANMFAGHMLLLVFALGASYLLTVGNYSVIFSPLSALLTVILTFFELIVEVLQAYVFTILTAVYVSGALAEEH